MGGKTQRNGKTTNTEESTSATEENKNELYTLEQVKEFLKIQEETFISYLNSTIERMDKKFDAIKEESLRKEIKFEKDLEELRKSLSFTGDSCNDNKRTTNERLKNMDKERHEFGEFIERKFAEMEDRNRRNNLRFDHIEEIAETETWEESEAKVREVIKDLGFDESKIKIERAHRVGNRRMGKRHRTIVAKFLNYKDRVTYYKSTESVSTGKRKRRI